MPRPSSRAFLPSMLPLIQAPMAGAQGSAMAAAVSNAGGLGSLPAAMLSTEGLATELAALSHLTSQPYNVNFFCHTPPLPNGQVQDAWHQALLPYYREFGLGEHPPSAGPGRAPFSHAVADVVEAFKPAVISFHFGLPAPDLLARVRGWGAQILACATTLEEALWLQSHGADGVIAQGLEAGGHRGHFLNGDLSTQMGTFALVPQLVAALNIPVIAAGGIATPEGVRAAMQLGATAIQVGTAYLLSPESNISALHRAALQSPAARHTAITNVFTGRPARGIVNRLVREVGPMAANVPPFPLATAAISPLRAGAEATGSGDFSPLWSGQNASACRALAAADVTAWLAQGFTTGKHLTLG
jgi:nitronate monooxygenase